MDQNFECMACEPLIQGSECQTKELGFSTSRTLTAKQTFSPSRLRMLGKTYSTELAPEAECKDGLTSCSVSAYSVGHVYNDLCCTIWFMYLLYYLIDVVKVERTVATLAILSGQIADGIATNIVGILIDKTSCRIGKTTPWYIFGTLLVIPSFLLTFNTCVICDFVCGDEESETCSTSTYRFLVYGNYIIFPALFNIGWASVQIATMSIVPTITFNQERRDSLVNYRNAFTYVSNLSTLIIALILFKSIKDDIWQFRILSLVVTSIGLTCTSWYLCGVKEAKLNKIAIESCGDDINSTKSDSSDEVCSCMDWLSKSCFYTCGAVYMFTRMAINITMTLIPFYLIYVLKFEKSDEAPTPLEIAMIPLASYFSSMMFSFFGYKPMLKYFIDEKKNCQTPETRLYPLAIGVFLVVVSSAPFLFLEPEYAWALYLFVPLQGIGLAIMLNISTSLISDMIGSNSKSVAFVYGSYSLSDKFMNGILLSIISETVIQDPCWLRVLTGSLPVFVAILGYCFASIGTKYMPQKCLSKLI